MFKIPSGYGTIHSKPLGTTMGTFIAEGAYMTTSGPQPIQVRSKEIIINEKIPRTKNIDLGRIAKCAKRRIGKTAKRKY